MPKDYLKGKSDEEAVAAESEWTEERARLKVKFEKAQKACKKIENAEKMLSSSEEKTEKKRIRKEKRSKKKMQKKKTNQNWIGQKFGNSY